MTTKIREIIINLNEPNMDIAFRKAIGHADVHQYQDDSDLNFIDFVGVSAIIDCKDTMYEYKFNAIYTLVE